MAIAMLNPTIARNAQEWAPDSDSGRPGLLERRFEYFLGEC